MSFTHEPVYDRRIAGVFARAQINVSCRQQYNSVESNLDSKFTQLFSGASINSFTIFTTSTSSLMSQLLTTLK